MPARTSPPSVRVVRILEALSVEPATSITLSGIARRLDLSPATCLGILNELNASGYVIRNADLAYRLGPAAVALGHAASAASPFLLLLHEALKALSADLSVPCNAATVAGDQIVVVEVAVPPGSEQAVRVGARFPFRAPAGITFAAWRDDERVNEWLAGSLMQLPDAATDQTWTLVRSSRRSGHLTRRLSDTEVALHELLSHTSVAASYDELAPLLNHAIVPFTKTDYIDLEDTSMRHHAAATASAPVFDANASPQYILTAHLMNQNISTRQLRAAVTKLRQTCDSLTEAIGGRNPFAP